MFYWCCLACTYRLIHGHFHIGLVIIPRPPYWPETQSRANMGRGMITRPIWKCPCIKLFITYFWHLEKRHPYLRTQARQLLEGSGFAIQLRIQPHNRRRNWNWWREGIEHSGRRPALRNRPVSTCKYIGLRRSRGPYWPGPIRALIWKWSCSNPITGYFPGV